MSGISYDLKLQDKNFHFHVKILTDYQWSLVSGPNTGTELHLDPLFAQSWNTLVSGHKMWALLPPDTEHRLLECDPKCSGHDKVWPSQHLMYVFIIGISGDFPTGLVAARPASDPGQVLVWREGSGRRTSQSS